MLERALSAPFAALRRMTQGVGRVGVLSAAFSASAQSVLSQEKLTPADVDANVAKLNGDFPVREKAYKALSDGLDFPVFVQLDRVAKMEMKKPKNEGPRALRHDVERAGRLQDLVTVGIKKYCDPVAKLDLHSGLAPISVDPTLPIPTALTGGKQLQATDVEKWYLDRIPASTPPMNVVDHANSLRDSFRRKRSAAYLFLEDLQTHARGVAQDAGEKDFQRTYISGIGKAQRHYDSMVHSHQIRWGIGTALFPTLNLLVNDWALLSKDSLRSHRCFAATVSGLSCSAASPAAS